MFEEVVTWPRICRKTMAFWHPFFLHVTTVMICLARGSLFGLNELKIIDLFLEILFIPKRSLFKTKKYNSIYTLFLG